MTIYPLREPDLTGLDWQEDVICQVDFATAEPAGPTAGDRYINTVTGNSSITAQPVTADYIYEWNGSYWLETVPDLATAVFEQCSGTFLFYNGAAWVPFGSGVAHNSLSGLDGGQAVPSEYYHWIGSEYVDRFLRDGSIAMTGDLDVGQNDIIRTKYEWQKPVKDRIHNYTPGAFPPPTVGDRYIIPSWYAGGGAWAGHQNEIVEWQGAWEYTTPTEGMALWDKSKNELVWWNGSAWIKIPEYETFDWQKPVKSCFLGIPPGAPSLGDRYLVPVGAGGAWTGHDTEIAVWEITEVGAISVVYNWVFYTPSVGWAVFCPANPPSQPMNYFYYFDGTNWKRWEAFPLTFTSSALTETQYSGTTNWQTKTADGIPNPNGDYIVFFSCQFGGSSKVTEFDLRIWDAYTSTELLLHQMVPSSPFNIGPGSHYPIIAAQIPVFGLSHAGLHNFELQFRTNTSTKTVAIKNARMIIWRIG